ncbi:m-AAA protease-interacting protein 1, mitochondrial [Hylaeus anthracinus]|uniref:m-AAA protease-interacting protein 1, mitochondrial n=1 Tax=Hylaeus anthracinus TaxID=313031 RepID=UPI0023B8CCE2|nr:m-AAA protease-interacting protein 1, mitochondrial [Hylaeus anthracinus]
MLFSVFKKCAFRMQMRNFSTFLVCNRSQIKNKLTHYWTELKCTSTINPSLTVHHRSFNTAPEEKICLPPLMDVPLVLYPTLFSWLKVWASSLAFSFTLDKEFNLEEFTNGALHAIQLVSRLLAAQQYEQLNGLVEDKTIEILKQNVSRLTEEQRSLITISENCIRTIGPTDMSIKKSETEDNNYTVEISKIAYYTKSVSMPEDDSLKDQNVFEQMVKNFDQRSIIICNYTFERNYVNGIGRDWIITVANHFTPVSRIIIEENL